MARAAIDIPADYRDGVRKARERERNRIARFVLAEMERNWDIATADRRPMCADTGLPRYYVRAGNEAVIEGGFVALERSEEHTSELQSLTNLVCRLLLEKQKQKN